MRQRFWVKNMNQYDRTAPYLNLLCIPYLPAISTQCQALSSAHVHLIKPAISAQCQALSSAHVHLIEPAISAQCQALSCALNRALHCALMSSSIKCTCALNRALHCALIAGKYGMPAYENTVLRSTKLLGFFFSCFIDILDFKDRFLH